MPGLITGIISGLKDLVSCFALAIFVAISSSLILWIPNKYAVKYGLDQLPEHWLPTIGLIAIISYGACLSHVLSMPYSWYNEHRRVSRLKNELLDLSAQEITVLMHAFNNGNAILSLPYHSPIAASLTQKRIAQLPGGHHVTNKCSFVIFPIARRLAPNMLREQLAADSELKEVVEQYTTRYHSYLFSPNLEFSSW